MLLKYLLRIGSNVMHFPLPHRPTAILLPRHRSKGVFVLKKSFTLLVTVLLILIPAVPALAGWTGGHDVLGTNSAKTTWYFAEGCTRPGFNTWICIYNPNGSTARVTFKYFLETGEVRTYPVACAPTSRTTVYVNATCQGAHDVSSLVTSNIPVVVERPMYFSTNGVDGGHCAMGVQSPETNWFFAEGCTQQGFQEWLSVLNPNNYAVNMTFDYYVENSSDISMPVSIPANTRFTQNVNDVVPPEQNVSVQITGDSSSDTVIAERPMYFLYQGKWNGGHDAVGATALSDTWNFAEGCTRNGFDTWITLENPSVSTLSVSATYMLGTGANVVRNYKVAPKSRKTVFLENEVGPGQDVSTSLTGSAPFAAERPMYFLYHGKWDGGSDSFGCPSPQSSFYFAEGCTRPNFETWICAQNPNSSPVTLRVNLYEETGKVVALPATTIPPGTRITIDANSAAGAGHDISITASCAEGLPIVVERSVYFDYTPTPAHPMGVDISEWNGRPDWNVIKAECVFAIIRSSYGMYSVDKSFAYNIRQARASGIPHGFYHYAYPDMAGHTPQAEAAHFAKTVGRLQKGEILALDMEEPFGDPGDWSLAFLQTLESIYHFKPYIYTYRYYLQTHDFSMVKAAGFPLWIAAYQDTKPITSWYAPLWQNTDQGPVGGDGDIFVGPGSFQSYGYAE
jgi:GH25 family lysozyme M1 (1,4-beta-N-acetylmuramidase)